MQKTLDDAIRRRDVSEDFDFTDVAKPLPVEAPPTHKLLCHIAPPTPSAAPRGLEWPKVSAPEASMTNTQRADPASAAERYAFRATCVSKVRERSTDLYRRKKPSPRRRVMSDDAGELVPVGVNNMAHEGASKSREYLRMFLRDGVRVLHFRYLQVNQMELVTPRHQEQALKEHLIALGYIIQGRYSPLVMQFRRE